MRTQYSFRACLKIKKSISFVFATKINTTSAINNTLVTINSDNTKAKFTVPNFLNYPQ